MPKRTFQPNRRHRSKTHGFLSRMKTKAGAAAPRVGTRSPSPLASATNRSPSSIERPLTQQQPISLLTEAGLLPELWSPRILGQVNNHYLKVARVHGEFPWHVHPREDELFLVLRGCLRIGRADADGGPVSLHAGEFFIIPRGTRHNTAASEETLIALFEPTSTAHTGEEITPLTRSLADQLAPR